MARCDAEHLVVGAGPAGLTLARLLARRGRDVLVVDAGTAHADRLELLAPASLGTVTALGLAPLLDDPELARPCLGIRRRWGTAEIEYDDFFRHPHQLGYVVDRRRFDEQLRAGAIASGARFIQARASGTKGNGVRLQIYGGTETVVIAGSIIDATGRTAAIARRRGARIAVRDRMVADLISDAPGDGANAPAWLDVERQDAAAWSYRVHGAGGRVQTWRVSRSGSLPATEGLRRVDASACIVSQAAGESWIAVGDAASAFDPIASQGLFNALSSALVAAGALLSRDGLNEAAAQIYSDAVAAAFHWSEAGRANVYARGAAVHAD
jgi:flavin-dependent dehydrogenase